jgi:nucleotide-binding universal stress UspA family protein
MKTILAAIDFSPISRRVERDAIALGRAIHGRVVLFHSVPPVPAIANEVIPLAGPILTLTDDVEKMAARHLRRIQGRYKKRGVAVQTLATSGFPAGNILTAARKLAADYIVIGSHGHTAFYDLVIGGTASGVLKRATCPVIVVPAAKQRTARRRPR